MATTLADYFWTEVSCDPDKPTALLRGGRSMFRLHGGLFLAHLLEYEIGWRIVSLAAVPRQF